eukprot:759851-Hanusia_phi.AAC.1
MRSRTREAEVRKRMRSNEDEGEDRAVGRKEGEENMGMVEGGREERKETEAREEEASTRRAKVGGGLKNIERVG